MWGLFQKNHETRIRIKKPGFNGKYCNVFFVAQVNVGDVDAIHVLDVGSCNNAAKLQQHDVQHACRFFFGGPLLHPEVYKVATLPT